jgi:hypothetical protein
MASLPFQKLIEAYISLNDGFKDRLQQSIIKRQHGWFYFSG